MPLTVLGPDFGCAIPATAASSVLTEDAIREGQVPLFTGAYRFKMLFCITIPCLVVFYLLCIYWSCKQSKICVGGEWVKQDSALSQFPKYFQLQEMDDRFMRQSYVKSLKGALPLAKALSLVGLTNLVIYLISPHAYNGPCDVDPMYYISIATLEMVPWVQWCWVLIVCGMQTIAYILANQFYQAHGKRKARGISVLTIMMASDDTWTSPCDRVVHQWIANKASALATNHLRTTMYYVLHLPCAVILSLPTIGFALAENTPISKMDWFVRTLLLLLSSPIVVAIANTAMKSLLLPSMARLLSHIKHGHTAIRDPVVCLSRIYTMFTIQVVCDVAMPVIVSFVIDESCNRYYLVMADELREMFASWGLAEIGVEAYLLDRCSRGIVSLYTYVWLNMAFINMALAGSWLVERDQRLNRWIDVFTWRFKQIKAKVCGFEDEEEEEDELVAVVNQSMMKIVDLYTLFVVTLVAGPLVPLIPVMLIPTLYLQYFVLQRLHVVGQRSFGLEIADTVLVSLPAKPFGFLVLLFMWLIQIFILIDLKFDIRPLAFSITSSLAIVPLVSYFYWHKDQKKKAKKKKKEKKRKAALEAAGHKIEVIDNPLADEEQIPLSPKANKSDIVVQLVEFEQLSDHAVDEIELSANQSPSRNFSHLGEKDMWHLDKAIDRAINLQSSWRSPHKEKLDLEPESQQRDHVLKLDIEPEPQQRDHAEEISISQHEIEVIDDLTILGSTSSNTEQDVWTARTEKREKVKATRRHRQQALEETDASRIDDFSLTIEETEQDVWTARTEKREKVKAARHQRQQALEETDVSEFGIEIISEFDLLKSAEHKEATLTRAEKREKIKTKRRDRHREQEEQLAASDLGIQVLSDFDVGKLAEHEQPSSPQKVAKRKAKDGTKKRKKGTKKGSQPASTIDASDNFLVNI